jgi:hypothetical protein
VSYSVKGVLFADYVRMIRAHKSVDWTRWLTDDDFPYLAQRIMPDDWYPMESFERMGNGILVVVANNDLQLVRVWGRLSVDQLRSNNPMLVAEGDPVETLTRFRILRSTFFDFEALELPLLLDDEAQVAIDYHMGPRAEEAASHQTMGFFERLLEMAGAGHIHAKFSSRTWAGDNQTLLDLSWKP